MTYDYKFSSQVCSTLKAIVGKRLDSYRLNSTDNSSFEIFVLRFPETDIEVATKEVVGIAECFKHAEDSIEFVRGLVIHLGNESIVFDKGAHNWEYIWSVQMTANAS